VIGFGSPDVEIGYLYEVPLKASGRRSITVKAVMLESIYNMPYAKFPHNVTWRFLQSRGATAICYSLFAYIL
jgi:hypothetical protein